MSLFFGIPLVLGLSCATLLAGYCVAAFLRDLGRLERLAFAALAGLGWLVYFASVAGAIAALKFPAVLLAWTPTAAALSHPGIRRQFTADLRSVLRSAEFRGAAGGALVVGLGLLLPLAAWPDLAFFDGKPNHDYFYWCIGAEYLQDHGYLASVAPHPANPVFALVKAIVGRQPDLGRMGTEGWLAIVASTVGRTPVEICLFAVNTLVATWLLVALAVARRTGMSRLSPLGLALACAAQPVLIFFIANGNLPNLLGALFSGGLWLLTLLLWETNPRTAWPLVAVGALCAHGLLCCYPDMLPFALLPIAAYSAWRAGTVQAGRRLVARRLLWIALGGVALNVISTERAWVGFWNAVLAVQERGAWPNEFAHLGPAEYLPGFLTLATPAAHLLGPVGGALATFVLAVSVLLLPRDRAGATRILLSLAGFFALVAYTALHESFDYGWQKAVQFSAIPLAAIFPFLLAGRATESGSSVSRRLVRSLPLIAGVAWFLAAAIGNLVVNFSYAGEKGLTTKQLALHAPFAAAHPGATVLIDASTFHADFFHSMWAARIFSANPVAFTSGDAQAGGYLHDFARRGGAGPTPPTALSYVDAGWAAALGDEVIPEWSDRVGALVRLRNRVLARTGLGPDAGVPRWAAADFSLTIQASFDGALELTLEANGAPGPYCELHGSVRPAVTGFIAKPKDPAPPAAVPVAARPDSQGRMTVRFPLRAGQDNDIEAHLAGAPAVAGKNEESRWPFRVVKFQIVRDAR